MGVYVACRHARHPQPPRQRRQHAVARAIAASIGTLQLDPQALRPEGVEQQPCGVLLAHPPRGAAGQTHQSLRVRHHRLDPHLRLGERAPVGSLAGVPVGERDDPAEVLPAARVAREQRQMTAIAAEAVPDPVRDRSRAPRAVTASFSARDDIDLGAVDCSYSTPLGHLRELHRSRDRVVIGQRQHPIPQLARALRELFRQRHAVQEGIGRVTMQLRVWWGARHRSHAAWVNQPPGVPRPSVCRSWKTIRLRPLVLTTSQ